MVLKFKQLEAALLKDLSLHKTINVKAANVRYATNLLDFNNIAKRLGIKDQALRFQWRKGKEMNPDFFNKIVTTFDLKL